MTHQEIIDGEVVERYVLGTLSFDERRAFQEHFFECDECFAQAQTLSKTIALVRYAAAEGAMDGAESRKASASLWSSGWLRPISVCAVAASLVLAAALVWLWFSRIQLQRELASERQARQSAEGGAQNSVSNAKREAEEKARELEAERARLQQQLDELNRNKSTQRPSESLVAQANITSVTLESTRDSGSSAQLNLPPSATKALLKIPIAIDNRFENYSVEILTNGRAPVMTIADVRPRSGILIVSVPAARLAAADYRVRLYGKTDAGRELLAEYDLRVIRK